MGLPQIDILFKAKAGDFLQRSERGTVLLLVNESGSPSVHQYVVSTKKDLDKLTTLTPDNQKLVKLCFEGGVRKIIVEVVASAQSGHTLADVFKTYSARRFNWVAYPGASVGDVDKLITWIKEQREARRMFKAVVSTTKAPDHEAIVNFVNKTVQVGEETFTGQQFTARVAGVLAGLGLNRSLTYDVQHDVTGCDPIVDMDATVDAGKLFMFEEDGKYKFSRAVTSLTTLTDKTADMKKIKIMEGMDLIFDDIRETFKNEYIGRVVNNATNKRLLVETINSKYLSTLEGDVLEPMYDNKVDIDIEKHRELLLATKEGQEATNITDAMALATSTGSNVYLVGQIKLVDAMEDLRISFTI